MIEKPPIAVQAAKVSWLAPLIAIGLGILVKSSVSSSRTMDAETARTIQLAVGGIAIFIVLMGLVFGFLALFGIKKHGVKGILFPAIVGVLLSSGYLWLIVSAVLSIRRLVQDGTLPMQ
jgi:hypothetical protein